jgi:hypothetical protein
MVRTTTVACNSLSVSLKQLCDDKYQIVRLVGILNHLDHGFPSEVTLTAVKPAVMFSCTSQDTTLTNSLPVFSSVHAERTVVQPLWFGTSLYSNNHSALQYFPYAHCVYTNATSASVHPCAHIPTPVPACQAVQLPLQLGTTIGADKQ